MLIVDEEDARTVRMIFHLYNNERLSITGLAARLNRLGIKRPKGGRQWGTSTLGRMLRNETYAGTLWHNRRKKTRVSDRPGQGLFVPSHPATKSTPAQLDRAEQSLDVEGLVQDALERTEHEDLSNPAGAD